MRRAAGLLVLAVLALLSGACGGAAPGEAVAEAAERAQEQGSARIFFTTTMSLPESEAGEMTMEGNGELDFRQQRGQMTMSFTGEGQAALSMQSIGEIEAVFDGFIIYMKMPFLTQMSPGLKPWLRMDLQALGEDMGVDFQQLAQLGQSNPAQGLDYLKGARDLEEVGEEEVRGVPTTHYRGVVDLETLQGELPADARASIENIAELTGLEEIPTEVWLDEDGLPRRIRYDFDYNPPADAPPAPDRMTMMMELFDYGAAVDVELPPKDQVTDLEEIVGTSP